MAGSAMGVALVFPAAAALLLSGCGWGNGHEAGAAGEQGGVGMGEATPAGAKESSAASFLMAKYGRAERPEVTLIKDADGLRERQHAIYSGARNGMLVAKWPDMLVIFDPDNNSVVKEIAVSSIKAE